MLAQYIDAVLSKPWAWGRTDCCFFAGDWILSVTERDPLGPYRGTYDSAPAALRLIRARRGLVRMVGAEMSRCGFARAEAANDGDIAVLRHEVDSDDAVAGAAVVIRMGSWWLARAKDGIVGMEAPTLAVWRVL